MKIFSLKRKMISRRGFSLIEILVALGIVSIISSIVIIGQTRFNNSVVLTNTAYQVALAIRQAQTYGSSVKYFAGTADYDQGYGIHFANNAAGDKSKNFVLFSDRSRDAVIERYDGADDPTCSLECVKSFTLGRGIQIARFCGITTTGVEECFQYVPIMGGALTYLDIMFFRPQLSACIRTNQNPATGGTRCSSNLRYSHASIYLRAPDGAERRVVVYASGQIDVE